ncbi:LacI family DNA-binding transcriptional regulator [Halobacillus mangrovi]|uniref:LacI family DNA-binding transcriptional regulator n=1 Tax=Halobacillus mangrovi TaxID=402384 RepID=UPI003D990102
MKDNVKASPLARPSIKDVAALSGVSTATVSHVINQTRFVAEETTAKVTDAMKQLNYSPNSIARSLRSQKSKTIGLLIPVKRADTSNFFFMTIAHGIEHQLKKHGYHLILSNSNEDLDMEKKQLEVFHSQLIDGLIMAPTAEDHTYLSEYLPDDYPTIFIDRKPASYNGDCILVDNAKGTYEAIQHLIDKGHKKIGYISGPLGLTTSDERYEGYRKALNDNGIDVDESLVKIGEASYHFGERLTDELLDESDMTALFIANNVMTIGSMITLQNRDVNIPDELAVIGFDDYEWTKVTKPALSVIKQPAFELGEKAAEVLLNRLKNPKEPFQEYRLPTTLKIRGSC